MSRSMRPGISAAAAVIAVVVMWLCTSVWAATGQPSATDPEAETSQPEIPDQSIAEPIDLGALLARTREIETGKEPVAAQASMPLEAAPDGGRGRRSVGQMFVRVVAATLVSIGLLLVLARFLRRTRGFSRPGNSGAIRIIQQHPIGLKSRLLLVQVAGELLLLSNQGNQIELLTRIQNSGDSALPEESAAIPRIVPSEPVQQIHASCGDDAHIDSQPREAKPNVREIGERLRNMFRSPWERMARQAADESSPSEDLPREAGSVPGDMDGFADEAPRALHAPREQSNDVVTSIREKVQNMKRLA